MTSADFSRLDAWIERKLGLDGTPGLSLVLTDREQTIYTGCYGMANVDAGTPVNPGHVFEIGSIGKSFTAMLLLRMQERGLIDLQQPVSAYLPWFAVKSDHEPITLHHLMTHTAGIIGGSDMSSDGRYETWHLRNTEVMGAPGEHFHYSNVGYKTLGYLIEEVLGKPYGDAVTEEILQPLGMTESFTPITNADRPKLAVAYRRQFNDRPRRSGDRLVPDTWIETSTADGSIAATAEDMAIYARVILARGNGLISDESFARMTADFAPRIAWEETATYGYGLMTWEVDGHRVIGHGGGMVGYYSQLTVDPELGIGVATMINGPGAPEEIAHVALAYARALANGEPSPELPELSDPSVVANAAEYAGVYTGSAGDWTFESDGDRLLLIRDGARTPLENRSSDRFFADVPGLDRDLIVFERVDDAVVALHHGDQWLGRDGMTHREVDVAPEHWSAYTGWYQCHNPWQPLFRIIERRGQLLMVSWHGSERPLIELSDGSFRVGESPSPSRLRFDAIAGGLALRADADGQMFYRTPASSVNRS